MKYLNYFKNSNKDNIKIELDYYWLILGDNDICLKVLDKFIKQMTGDHKVKSKEFTLRQALKYNYSNIYGVYLYYENKVDGKDGFTYWIVENDKKDLYKANRFNKENTNYIYQGELKLINNELVLDTIDIDANKYNI